LVILFYVIQENTFNEDGYDRLINAFNRLSLSYEVVKVLPFVEELTFNTTRNDVFTFGSIKLSRLAKNYPWSPGSYPMPHNHSVICENKYQENMLNHNTFICPIEEMKVYGKGLAFIRPVNDDKLFKGALYDSETWEKTKEATLANNDCRGQRAVLASPKTIYKESRFWVVNGKISTYSTYRFAGQVNYQAPVDNDEISFANEMINIFQPQPSFVIDICITENGPKIVECGCINSAGFYSADMNKLLVDLESQTKI
jgi:hypothetical protein